MEPMAHPARPGSLGAKVAQIRSGIVDLKSAAARFNRMRREQMLTDDEDEALCTSLLAHIKTQIANDLGAAAAVWFHAQQHAPADAATQFVAGDADKCFTSCANCYCFVCDSPVAACRASGDWGQHCLAQHAVPRWQQARAAWQAKSREQLQSAVTVSGRARKTVGIS